jgi:ATP-dependent DNA helicase
MDSPAGDVSLDALEAAEARARLENERSEEEDRVAAARKKKRATRQHPETKAEREAKARELDELLKKSAAFSDILTKKTEVLGRVGSGVDGKTLGEHDLKMAKQPKCMKGGTMRDYQLEGLTWMYEICLQGMSGILADEMGLGKFCQAPRVVNLGTDFNRQNGANHLAHCSPPRARGLPWPSPHRGAPLDPLQLDRRV